MSHGEVSDQADWGASKDCTSLDVRWAAFFGDVKHSIEYIRAGARVTVAFILRSAQPADTVGNSGVVHVGAEAAAPIFRNALSSAMQDPEFATYGDKLAFTCYHMYTNTLFPAEHPGQITTRNISKLKGRDALVAGAAVSLGLDVRVVPFLQEDCAE